MQKNKFGENSPEFKQAYELGDMNTTVVRTANGKTIMIQHDTTSPRPYSRIHMISGTGGIAQKWPVEQIALEPNAHEWLAEEEYNKLLAKYEHPLVKKIGEMATRSRRSWRDGLYYGLAPDLLPPEWPSA